MLVRSPYGRRQVFGLIFGRTLAERGLQVVIQSTRGTFGSGGDFDPFDERADGLKTLDWIRRAALARRADRARRAELPRPRAVGRRARAGDDIAALAIQVSRLAVSRPDVPGRQPRAGDVGLLAGAHGRAGAPARAAGDRPRAGAAVEAAARAAARRPRHARDRRRGRLVSRGDGQPDARRRLLGARDYARDVAQVTAPVQLVGGWYDIFLPWMLEDFAALRAAGRETQLIIGPWAHTSPGLVAAGMREALGWLREHLLGDDRLVRPDARAHPRHG